MWDDEQRKRYARQWVLPGWGEDAQAKLAGSRVLVVGVGGLGSSASLYLAAAGVGTMVLADPDTVELSNLNRQILHSTQDIDRPKVESARKKIEALNPHCKVEAHQLQLTPDNSTVLFRNADIVLDCTDGFPNKYLLNETAISTGTPLVHAGVLAWGGQVFFIAPGRGPCLACVFPHPPENGNYPTSETVGILGAVAGLVGIIEATEAIKFLTGAGENLVGQMLTYDALNMHWQKVRIAKDDTCPVCGTSQKKDSGD